MKATDRGFTLLEVLVALVIVGLGMIAVFGQISQSLTATARLRDKTLATWVGNRPHHGTAPGRRISRR